MTTLTFKAKAIVCALLLLALAPAVARGEEAWLADFEQTCSRTGEAMALSTAELKGKLDRCDELQKIIESREESVRKVYLKRLQLCRNLYAYVLEYKKGGQASK
jgi:hypothetical protein